MVSRKKILLIRGMVAALCLLSFSPSAQAGGDFPPLTEDEIRTFWKKNPNFDANSYINNSVVLRKVAFFPTKAIRKSLQKFAPVNVIDSLKSYPHESAKFRFQVTKFSDRGSALSEEKKTRLYELIREKLEERRLELSNIFEHVKETAVAVGSFVDGVPKRAADGFPGPRIYLLGTLKKAGGNVNIANRLIFQSKIQETTLGKMKPMTIPLVSEDHLKKAADKMVTEIFTQLQEEIASPIP